MALSKYARKFDMRCVGWTNTKNYNLMFVKHQENYFNDLLRMRGYVFLRDVYEGLGFPITRDSCIAGWMIDEQNVAVVQFTIQETDGSDLILDFNAEENILDKFE